MAWIVVALIVAAALAWWIVHRSARLRRETAAREARMLEALFEARRAGAEAVDVEGVFGVRDKEAGPADEALREARLQAEIAAALAAAPGAVKAAAPDGMAAAKQPAAPGESAGAAAAAGPGKPAGAGTLSRADTAPAAVKAAVVDEAAAADRVVAVEKAGAAQKTAAGGLAYAGRPPGEAAQAAAAGQESPPAAARGFEPRPAAEPHGQQRSGVGAESGPAYADDVEVPVRDLVQVFYEARGFRAAPAAPSAQPIELVLTHKSDPRRAYAFAPITGSLSPELVAQVVARARAIDQLRVLIAVETPLAAEAAAALPAQGVRAFDRAAIQAQLARLDAALAEKLLAAARRRAARQLAI